MLEQNDRLTNEFGNAWFIATGQPVAKYWSTANKARLIQRLGEYEDTGYTPEEIKGFLKKHATRIGDIVEYMNTPYEVVDFKHNFEHNLICLQALNDDRHHEADYPVFLFSPDYKRRT
jgi:hypothetical protein